MTKNLFYHVASCLVVASVAATTAGADERVGWDFSQYTVDGALSVGGAAPTDTLSANYATSTSSGTLFMNGTLGSTDVNEAGGSSAEVVPASLPAGDSFQGGPAGITAGQSTFVPLGDDSFNALTLLLDGGQTDAEYMALTARSAASITFRADSAAVNDRWLISFGARTVSGTASVGVDFDEGCDGGFATLDTVNLTTDEQEVIVGDPNAQSSTTGCFRLVLTPGTGQPLVDNVAVPEPGVLGALAAGALALVGLARRREA